MSEDSPKVINAFTRKAFEPTEPSKEVEVVIDEVSLALVEEMLERVKAGKITHLSIVGICEGFPISAIVSKDDSTVAKLSLINLAVDTLKGQIRDQIDDFSRSETIDPEKDDA